MAQLVTKATSLMKSGFEASKPALHTFRRYAIVELVPPKPSEFSQIWSSIGKLITAAKTGGYRNITVREGVRNTLVTIEVACWFFIGECIGKRHIVGYKV